MAMPAGFSSDEEEFDEIYYYSVNDLRPIQNGIDHKNKDKWNLNQEPEQDKECLLYMAIILNNLDQMKSILDTGMNVNQILKDGWTPLLLACSTANFSLTEELIKRGVDVDLHKDMFTPLMAACKCPESTTPFSEAQKVVDLLVKHGADVNAATRKRMTPLMYAASSGNVEVVRYLLPLVNKEAVDNQGWTALFWAVNDNKPEVVQVLLEAGLQAKKIDIRCNTPIHYAIINEYEQIIAMLPARKKIKDVYVLQEQYYDLDNVYQNMKNYRPRFLRDILCMLYGMKCENYLHKFENSDIDLFRFLTMNENDLIKFGVEIPYMKRRILMGLHRFHIASFQQSSIPIVGPFELFSTIDVAKSILSAIRHLTVMEASLQYIIKIYSFDHRSDPLLQSKINDLKWKVKELKVICNILKKRATQWDSENQTVDLITEKSLKAQIPWLKILTRASFITPVLYFITKLRKIYF